MIDDAYPENSVYRVHWGAKELKALAMMVGLAGGKRLSQEALARLAATAMKKAGAKIGPLGALLVAADVAANPWTVARTRADMTGAALADLLARTDENQFVLVGHSLGGRVMAKSAMALATRSEPPLIKEIHLLGAAVGRGREWLRTGTAVEGAIYNYYSSNDKVLGRLYKMAELGTTPVGLKGIGASDAKLRDRNVSRQVNGHSDYFEKVDLALS